LTLINQNSLLQNTVERILQIDSDPQHIFISTGTQYREQSLDQLANYHVDKIITEPERRNTAPAIAYIIKYLEDVEKIQSDSIILVCPSDHHIAPVEKYASCIQEGMQYAQE
jgi:mannose-1-phosphate guanylyltransferase